jgi:hypothetical protein
MKGSSRKDNLSPVPAPETGLEPSDICTQQEFGDEITAKDPVDDREHGLCFGVCNKQLRENDQEKDDA